MAKKFQPIVQELVDLIKKNKWEDDFETAIKNAKKYKVKELDDIHNLEDYLDFMNDFLHWIPKEKKITPDYKNPKQEAFYILTCKFYFVLDQHTVKK